MKRFLIISFGFAMAAICPACSDVSVGNLGVEGASCVKSPDCEPPLQCIAQICVGEAESQSSASTGQLDASDGVATPSDSSLGPVTDSGGDVVQNDDQQAADSGETGDALQRIKDIGKPLDLEEYDLVYWDDVGEGPEPMDAYEEPAFSDCEELGIADQWAGNFVGTIDYDIESGGLFDFEEGWLLVGGDLSFEIVCIDSKLIVQGMMDGYGSVAGDPEETQFPFELGLSGFYSPATQTLNAQMVDGVVTIFGLLEIYFEGEINGQLSEDGIFEGPWSGESHESNVPTVTGDAYGEGTWSAEPVISG